MNKGCRQLLLGMLSLSVCSVQAAPVPVVEVTEAGMGSSSSSSQPRALSAQNEMFFMVQQLQDEVRSLRGIIEQQQYRLDQLETQQRDRYRDMDKRISLLFQQLPEGSGLSMTEGAVAEAPASAAVSPATLPPTTVPPAAAGANVSSPMDGGGPDADESAGYDAAFARVRARDFAAAESELKTFISQYPNSSLKPNAWYWLGEVYLAQQKNTESQAAFMRVVEDHPQHAKAADALYKLGVLSGRTGDEARARELMQRVVQEYPQAPAADLARGYLKP